MLDTTIVDYFISLNTNQLKNWRHTLTEEGDEYLENKYNKVGYLDNNAALSCIYYPSNPRYTKPRLSIQASLPKVLYGNNIEEITTEDEIIEAIGRVNNYIGGVKWLPEIDFGAGRVWRIDPVYNHQVGQYVPEFIKALSLLWYPQRKTQPYLYEGVQFYSRSAITKFYDKQKESKSSKAIGILRHETEMNHGFYIKRINDQQSLTLREVTFPFLKKILRDDLEKLRLLHTTIVDKSTAQVLLIDKYGYRYGNTLFGHLQLRQNITREQLLLQAGISARTIREYDKHIMDAGISLSLADDHLALPPLEIIDV
jgi:hypothetical protein